MIGPFAGSGVRSGTCLGEWISEYVDGTLSALEQYTADRHLILCQGCRAEVELERRLRATLRCEPRIPDALLSMLMSLSAPTPVPQESSHGVRVSSIPDITQSTERVSAGRAPGPLRVLAPNAPAQHRSALRAAACASGAAGASIAAVWAVTAAPVASVRPGAPAAATPSRPAVAPSSSVVPASVNFATLLVGSRAADAARGAQSTP